MSSGVDASVATVVSSGMEQEFTDHLSWNLPLRRVQGGSPRLLDGIDVFVDFHWEALIGHPQRTFTNYMSLKDYIQRYTRPGRRPALLLTNQAGKNEGCRTNHHTHDIFVVNILTYKGVAKNDAAGAYFAGLQGSPIINPDGLSEETKDSLLESIGSVESIGKWINRHADRISLLWSEIGSVALGSAETNGLIVELTKRTGALSFSDIQRIESFLSLPNFPSSALEAANLAHRRAAVTEFERELGRDEWHESDWQKFFKREKWIFGHGLLYIFLEPLESEANVGGKDLSNTGGRKADYAVKAKGQFASFFALVEIKVPSATLVGPMYRNHAHGIHENLSGPLSQIIGMCDEWNREGSRQEANQRRAVEEGWSTAQPRGILVVGHTKQFVGSEDRKRSFELFRRQMHGVEILTFDELFIRAQQLISLEQPGE
jgi:Domain of unknown function (DUF4263)